MLCSAIESREEPEATIAKAQVLCTTPGQAFTALQVILTIIIAIIIIVVCVIVVVIIMVIVTMITTVRLSYLVKV